MPKISEMIKGQVLLCLIATFSAGTIFGFCSGIQEPLTVFLEKKYLYKEDETILTLFKTAFVVGAFVSAPFSGFIADLYGRKKMILIGGIIALLTNIITILGLPVDIWFGIVGRFFMGVSIGILSSTVPLMLSEVTPSEIRGPAGVVFQFAITFSIFLGAIGLFTEKIDAWYALIALTFVPILTLLLSLIKMQESPRFLVGRDDDKAKEIFLSIYDYKKNKEEFVNGQISEIRARKEQKSSWGEIFTRKNVKPISIGVILAIAQQLTGINVIIYYFRELIKDFLADMDKDKVLLVQGGAYSGLMAWNFITSMISIPLISRFGRKKLLFFGQMAMLVGMVIATIGIYLDVKEPVLVAISIFILGFEFSVGPLFWVVINEIFAENLRGKIAAMMNAMQWMFNSILTLAFGELKDHVKLQVFYIIFACIGALTLLGQMLILPETKDKKFEEIQEMLGN